MADSSNGIGAPTFHHPLSYGSFGEGKRDYTCIAEEYCIGLFSNCAEQDFKATKNALVHHIMIIGITGKQQRNTMQFAS